MPPVVQGYKSSQSDLRLAELGRHRYQAPPAYQASPPAYQASPAYQTPPTYGAAPPAASAADEAAARTAGHVEWLAAATGQDADACRFWLWAAGGDVSKAEEMMRANM